MHGPCDHESGAAPSAMSLTWTLLGSFGQMLLAVLLFMVAAFVGGGVASGSVLNKLQSGVLDLALLALPGTCVVSAVAVIWLHLHGGGPAAYGWYALPLAATLLYLAYVFALTRHG